MEKPSKNIGNTDVQRKLEAAFADVQIRGGSLTLSLSILFAIKRGQAVSSQGSDREIKKRSLRSSCGSFTIPRGHPYTAHTAQQCGRTTDVRKASSMKKGLVGSIPPVCHEPCQTCNPCVRVAVSIQTSGSVLPNEYYPEAWRCQCGSSQFDP
ncbi:hypothetical protein KP509_01G006500 [Ceratopteris richardii]|uniref:Epidermal patterning factor-like protein n=1 Tax=Ceratopteris richardii TaxID=49495 RepID=A0A8T2VA70_CERRI|nr:hypothetical protein KP509_01G006500 [Ceratopteris richardii]